MGSHGRGLALLARLVWVAFTALLAVLAVGDLVASILERDSRFVRNSGSLIVLAALTALVCLAALLVAVRSLRARPSGSLGRSGAAALTFLAVLMTFVYVVASILNGPL